MQKHCIKLKCNKQNYFSTTEYGFKLFPTFPSKINKLMVKLNYSSLHIYENKSDKICKDFFFEKLKKTWPKKNYSTKNHICDSDILIDLDHSANNKIYVKENIYDIIEPLCKNKKVEEISANVIFFVLKFLNTKNVATVDEYKDNIKRIYFNLIKCYHKIFKSTNENGEFIFCIFNDDIIKSVSPSLKKSKKTVIHDMVLNSLEFYFKNNINNMNRLNINLLCEIIKYKNFFYVLNNINYDKNQLKEKLNVKNIDYLFHEFLNDKIYFSNAVELASLFYSEKMSITKPFKKDSTFNCLILLKNILNIQSKNLLFLFLNSLKYNCLKKEIFLFLLSADSLTGFPSNYWGYLATREYLLLYNSEVRKIDGVKKIEINDETKKGENYEYSNNINNEYYNLPYNMKNILLLRNINEFKKLMISLKNEQQKHWEEKIYNIEDTYNIESHGNIITIQDINDNLKKKKKRYFVAIDLEWYKNQQVSIISISTNKQIYIVDLLNIDYNFKLLTYSFFKWLLENPFIYKLFYNFSSDMQKISSFFQNISHLNSFVNVIDLKDPLYINTKSDKNINCDYNVFNFELFNRDIIEKNDTDLFKKVINSNLYDLNNKIKNNCNKFENTIIFHEKINKIHFKSLNDMCQNFLKRKLNKQLQLSDWRKRPLTEDQINYASIDSYNLIEIEEKLTEYNYSSTCLSNNNNLINIFIQKYKMKNCIWE
ncbi:exonuclease, putative [Plasmodium gallinaceum]|uniref:Exonuclease, putative n=1 Tax=Plasmodium gallinaceum TaxID=5849 RepID=A0A1J1GNW0_PLAGA|nr:exonuclease, putative [Plasmodium gallinaceum]CRG93982.1 exonuclease, putative [Plasmodium gallinaceum]